MCNCGKPAVGIKNKPTASPSVAKPAVRKDIAKQRARLRALRARKPTPKK